MRNFKNFSELRDEVRRDSARGLRIDLAKKRAIEEIATCRLTELREALGITQVTLADMIGKSQSALSQIESGDIGLVAGDPQMGRESTR